MKDISSPLLFRKTCTCTGSLFIVAAACILATVFPFDRPPTQSLYPWTSMFLRDQWDQPLLLHSSLLASHTEIGPFELEFVARFVALGRRSNNWKERIFVLRDFSSKFRSEGFLYFPPPPRFLINEVAFKKGEVDILGEPKIFEKHQRLIIKTFRLCETLVKASFFRQRRKSSFVLSP